MHFIRLLIFFLFFQQLSIAQQFNYTNFNTSQGLPSSEVYDLLQDRKGYMWFATDQGVARYNGKEFTTYTIANGLLDNTVLRMAEDSKGRIWFVSHSNEICYWQDDSIYKSPLSDLFLAKIAGVSEVVFSFFIDSSDNIWIGSYTNLYFSDHAKNYSTLQQLQMFKDCNVTLKAVGDKRVLLMMTLHKGLGMDPTASHVTLKFGCERSNSLSYNNVSFSKPQSGKLFRYFRSAISKDGTIYFSAGNLLFSIPKNKEVSVTKFKCEIIGLSVDPQNGLWVGFMKEGVSYYKNSDLSKSPLAFLNNCSIGAISFDHEGGVWLISLEKGVFYIPSTSIFVYTNVSVLNDHIVSINKIKEKLLVNTFGRLMYEVTPQHAIPFETLNNLQKKNDLIALKQLGDTVYGIYGGGLIAFDSNLKFLHDWSKIYGLGGNNIFQTKDHTLWITDPGSIKKITNLNQRLVPYKPSARAACVLQQEDDFLFGTKKGLLLFKDRKFYNQAYKNPLLKSPIVAMLKDENNDLWLATVGNGVLRVKDDTVTQFQKKDGLISNTCTTITRDQYNNIWVGTNNGLTCIKQMNKEKKNWLIKNITVRNGINSDEITKLYADQNTLWIGTMAGLSFLEINNAIKTAPPSPAYIHSIKINNKSIHANQHEFTYNENNLKFELNGLTFSDNGDHHYRYRLIGLDTSWQETKINELLINNLPPGNYTLQAQVANTDNVWSTQSANYMFTINKPFWFTWWFILLEILLAALIVYFIILWRTNIIRKKEEEKLRINKLLSEYQMKALTAQMNPHFIFNAINSIQNFIIQNHSTLAYDYLIKFSKLIRMVLNNSKDNEISLKQEMETLAIYIELEQLRFENSFDYHVSIQPELDTDSLVIPALLLQPYIENAIWHGLMPLKNRKGIITLAIIEQNTFLKITITDNGIGRTASDLIKKKIVHKTHQSIGMELTGKRIEVFGQESKFSLQIIDNYNDQGLAKGTTVEIILPMIDMY